MGPVTGSAVATFGFKLLAKRVAVRAGSRIASGVIVRTSDSEVRTAIEAEEEDLRSVLSRVMEEAVLQLSETTAARLFLGTEAIPDWVDTLPEDQQETVAARVDALLESGTLDLLVDIMAVALNQFLDDATPTDEVLRERLRDAFAGSPGLDTLSGDDQRTLVNGFLQAVSNLLPHEIRKATPAHRETVDRRLIGIRQAAGDLASQWCHRSKMLHARVRNCDTGHQRFAMTRVFPGIFAPGIAFAALFSMGRPMRMFVKERAYFITQRCFQTRMLLWAHLRARVTTDADFRRFRCSIYQTAGPPVCR